MIAREVPSSSSFLLSPGSSLRRIASGRSRADLGSRALRNTATRRTTLSRRRHSALEYVLHFWSTTHFEIFTYTTKMISRAITRSLPRHALRPACRQFSSSSQRLAEAQAAEIKKLGVIGAGQMVRGIVQDTVRELGLTRRKRVWASLLLQPELLASLSLSLTTAKSHWTRALHLQVCFRIPAQIYLKNLTRLQTSSSQRMSPSKNSARPTPMRLENA